MFVQILLDLAYAIPSLTHSLSPLLVHCSAGVGRTGTFIGFFKLISDIINKKVKKFSVFETVVEMRRLGEHSIIFFIYYVF